MKLHLADTRNRYSITGYGIGYLSVNGIRYEHPLIVSPEQAPERWGIPEFAALTAAATESLLRGNPEIIILGTGSAQHFADPGKIRPLIDAGVGIETMSTPAACRTYNILMGEGRRVVAAMFLP